MTTESMLGAILLGVGSVGAVVVIAWIRGLINAQRKEKILEIDLALKNIVDSNADKSLSDLVNVANKSDRPGNSSDPS
jgi:hypothetical protein